MRSNRIVAMAMALTSSMALIGELVGCSGDDQAVQPGMDAAPGAMQGAATSTNDATAPPNDATTKDNANPESEGHESGSTDDVAVDVTVDSPEDVDSAADVSADVPATHSAVDVFTDDASDASDAGVDQTAEAGPDGEADGAADGSDGDADSGGDLTTGAVLTSFSPGCLSCANTSGCLDPDASSVLGTNCEQFTGTATTECLATLQCVVDDECFDASTPDVLPCLCGTADETDCAEGMATPNGPCAQEYFTAFGTQDVTQFVSNLYDPTYPAGNADEIMLCLAMVGCSECF